MDEPTGVERTSADREAVVELVAAGMDAFAEGGDVALAAFCAGLTEHRDAVLARLRTLRSIGMLDAPAVPFAVPTVVANYELGEPLGAGGMGVVYRARCRASGQDVALKFVRADQLHVPGVRERFQREIATIRDLAHDGIVRLLEFGEENGAPWFAMEFVDGASIADVLAACAGRRVAELSGSDFAVAVAAPVGSVPLFSGSWLDVVLRIARRAAEALAAAHARGVLHRDLKPSNLMVTPAGRVVLLDFGLARPRDADRLTRSGAQVGTLQYMAPEQLRGDATQIDERTDVYALGVVLRELLTLRPAFGEGSVDTIASRIRGGAATPFGNLPDRAWRDAALVCATAMDVDRMRRYASAGAFARDLERVADGRSIVAVRPGFGLRLLRTTQRHPTLAAAATVAVVALALAPLAIAWRERALRTALEAEVRRADANLGLAARALQSTLARIDDEDLVEAPELRQFSDGVLVDTGAFLDALAATNPAEPAARLALAETLARAGFVRWKFFDLPRTEAVFRRALELLAAGDTEPDRTDVIELDVRLALVYVAHVRGEAEIAEYADLLTRVAARGPIEARSAPVRERIARCLDRHGRALRAQGEVAGLVQLERALAMRQQLAREAPTVAAWVEVAQSALALVEDTAGRDAPSTSPAEATLAEATARALAIEPGSATERSDLIGLLQSLAARAQAGGEFEVALELCETSERLAEWFTIERPSRLDSGWRRWIGIRAMRMQLLERLDRRDVWEVVTQDTLVRLENACAIWPRAVALWRGLLMARTRVVAFGRRGRMLDIDAAVASGLRDLQRIAELGIASATLSYSAAEFRAACARHRLSGGDPVTALQFVDAALIDRRDAAARGISERVSIRPDTDLRLFRAEVLLALTRVDDVVAELDGLGDRLPHDLLAVLPGLEPYRTRPAVAELVERAGRR